MISAFSLYILISTANRYINTCVMSKTKEVFDLIVSGRFVLRTFMCEKLIFSLRQGLLNVVDIGGNVCLFNTADTIIRTINAQLFIYFSHKKLHVTEHRMDYSFFLFVIMMFEYLILIV